MSSYINDKIVDWQQNSPDGPIYPDIHSFILFRAKRSFKEYHPAIGPFPSFEKRFEEWLRNIEDDHIQQVLFQLVPKLFFVGIEEFESLYQTAMTERIEPWLIDTCKIDIFARDYETRMEQAKNNTWFCPITDSFHISDFCHVNRISGIEHRPDWHSLATFGSIEKIADFINTKQIRNIVLLEDFIGTGNQVTGANRKSKRGAVTIARELLERGRCKKPLHIQIIPLLICLKGLETLKKYTKNFSRIIIEPIIELPSNLFISNDTKDYYPGLYDVITQLLGQYGIEFVGGSLGYEKTGALVIISNCKRSVDYIPHFPCFSLKNRDILPVCRDEKV